MSLILTETEKPSGYVSEVRLRNRTDNMIIKEFPFTFDPVTACELLPPNYGIGLQLVVTLTDPKGQFDSLSSHFLQTNPVGGFVDSKPILPNEIKILGTEGHAGIIVTGVVIEEEPSPLLAPLFSS
jgi:hypothetical protein